jgi:hypothetical protein
MNSSGCGTVSTKKKENNTVNGLSLYSFRLVPSF